MDSDCEILVHALRPALRAWDEAARERTLLGRGVPGETILSPLASAIKQCAAYKAVAGYVLFTAYSGPVLHAPSLAAPLLYRAEGAQWDGRDIAEAADWLIRLLSTREADGTFTAAIWGLSVDKEAPLQRDSRLLPFNQLPDSRFKKLISDRAAKLWNGEVWRSQRFFDLPGAAIIQKVADFPFIRTDGASFEKMAKLEADAHNILVFLQGRVASRPLVLGYWFEYDDQDLDLNAHENYVSWILPEVLPRIAGNVALDAATIGLGLQAFSAFPRNWRDDLKRSMERFALSQCRYQMIDRILDLTLAFEIAVSGRGEQAPQSWKVSVRSAQMIGGPLSERQENRRKMVALYNLRNRGTHGSSLADGDRERQESALSDAVTLYRKLLDSFWRLGDRPEWDAIELEPPSTE